MKKELFENIQKISMEDNRIIASFTSESEEKRFCTTSFKSLDLIFITDQIGTFYEDRSFFKKFGKVLRVVEPEVTQGYMSTLAHYAVFLQLENNEYICLVFLKRNRGKEVYDSIEQAVIFCDKEKILPEKIPFFFSPEQTRIPSESEFQEVCSEFWWVSNLVAKGIWHEELILTMDYFNFSLRKMLFMLLDWYIQEVQGQKEVGVGMENQLPRSWWRQLKKTYPNCESASMWNALNQMGDLFRKVAFELMEFYGFTYDFSKDLYSIQFWKAVRKIIEEDKEETYDSFD